jgi:hypothetical protein
MSKKGRQNSFSTRGVKASYYVDLKSLCKHAVSIGIANKLGPAFKLTAVTKLLN